MEDYFEEVSKPAAELERSGSEDAGGGAADNPPVTLPKLMASGGGAPNRVAKLSKPKPRIQFTPEQRMLLLDLWSRSNLPAKDFGALVGLNYKTLYGWKRAFEKFGPEGLLDDKKGAPPGSRMSEAAKRAILMMKEQNPEYGINRISDMLYRGFAINVSPAAVSSFLKGQGYELESIESRRHPDKIRHFERAKPNQLWQTDLFTFILKRQNRRVHLVAFMDDHSRFIVGWGLHASASGILVIETLRSALASFGVPEEILTDNGSQYITWRGKSAFAKELERRGIKHIVATPRRPQTLGKIERFWGTLWKECVETAVFQDLGDARKRIGLFVDYYNFQRTHQGIDGLFPADRFFEAAPDVLKALRERVNKKSLDYAVNGLPKAPFYLTGNVGGRNISVHAEGERVYMVNENGSKQEVDLTPESTEEQEKLPEPVCTGIEIGSEVDEEMAPGESPLDEVIKEINNEEEGRESEEETK